MSGLAQLVSTRYHRAAFALDAVSERGRSLARVVRAELLVRLGRPDDAKRWARAAVEDIAGTPLLQRRTQGPGLQRFCRRARKAGWW